MVYGAFDLRNAQVFQPQHLIVYIDHADVGAPTSASDCAAMIALLVAFWAALSGVLVMAPGKVVRVKRHGWDKEEEEDEPKEALQKETPMV